MSQPRHFLDLDQIDPQGLREILNVAARYKARSGQSGRDRPLADRTLAMIFEKPSTRTRVSFEIGMTALGGHAITLHPSDTQLGRGESIADTARVLSRYVDVIMFRAIRHESLLELAANAAVPVINGLTNRSHPCQLMADVFTFEERLGPIAGRIVAWVGDGNNVAVSWIHAAVQFGFELRLACPKPLEPAREALAWARAKGGRVVLGEDAEAAVGGADCVVTDTWVSMNGGSAAEREALLAPYQVNDRLMSLAKPSAIFMHCLPATRGKEVAASVIDGPQSVVWDEAENRAHAQKGILLWCLR